MKAAARPVDLSWTTFQKYLGAGRKAPERKIGVGLLFASGYWRTPWVPVVTVRSRASLQTGGTWQPINAHLAARLLTSDSRAFQFPPLID